MLPVILISWGVFVLFFIVVKIYASRLSRNEDDQLILQDSSGVLKAEQAAIMGKLRSFKPVQLTATWALAVATLGVVVYFVLDAINQFK
jgi:hypothetical protein